MWHRAGKQAAILSGRRAAAVERRAAELKIAHVLQGHEQKAAPLRTLIEGLGLSPRQVCFVGDDLADLPVLQAVGLAACPADAVAEVKDAAHLITQAPGGRGAVREVVEVILKSQGRWSELIGFESNAGAGAVGASACEEVGNRRSGIWNSYSGIDLNFSYHCF